MDLLINDSISPSFIEDTNANNILYHNEFDGAPLGGWTVVEETANNAPSDWIVYDGILVHQSNIGATGPIPAFPKAGTYITYDAGLAWSDYNLKCTLHTVDDDGMGIVFRYQDDDNYYRLFWRNQVAHRAIVKKTAGIFTSLAADFTVYNIGAIHNIEINLDGDQIDLNIDGSPVFSITDSDHPVGTFGAYCWFQESTTFQDFLIIDSLGATLFESEWDSKTILDPPTVIPSGGSVGEWRQGINQLEQTSNAFLGSGAADDLEGTHLIYKDGFGFDDYAVRFDFQSDDDDQIGIMFRYQDEDNYYRFNWSNQNSTRRITRKDNGNFLVLLEQPVPYVISQRYTLEIRAFGPNLLVYLDGDINEIINVTDANISGGTFAFYCFGNAQAIFDDVRVQKLQWISEPSQSTSTSFIESVTVQPGPISVSDAISDTFIDSVLVSTDLVTENAISQAFIETVNAVGNLVIFDSVSDSFIETVTVFGDLIIDDAISQSFIETVSAEANLSIEDSISQSFTETVSLQGVANLVIGDSISQGFIQTVTMAGVGDLVIGDVLSESFIETVDISSVNNLTLQDAISNSFIETVTVSMVGNILPNDSISQAFIDTVTVTSDLNIEGAISQSFIETLAVVGPGSLVIQASISASFIEPLTLTTAFDVGTNDLISQTFIESPSISGPGNISIDDSISQPFIDSLTIEAFLDIQESISASFIESVTVSSVGDIELNDIISESFVDTMTAQSTAIVANDSISQSFIDSVMLSSGDEVQLIGRVYRPNIIIRRS